MFRRATYSEQLTFFQKLRSFDFILMFCIFAVGIISCFSMYSTDGGEFLHHSKSHILRFLIFFLMMIFLSFLSIRFWHAIGYFFYFIVLIFLLWASFYGVSSSGSQRWISLYFINLQPSELMKIGIIICFAKFYHRSQIDDINKFTNILIPITLLIVPILLVLNQPDLGTSILIALTGLAVIWLAGLNIKYFIYSLLISLISMPFIISFLKPYQKLRILTFFNPERDPLGAGYQIIQSKIAVGSGGFLGKGFLQGSQSYLDYLPEKHTDFIFTLFSEEFGFVGSILLLIVYALIIYRIILIGGLSKSNFAKLYCFGFAAAFFVYVTVNMSMVLGLLPIVGSPLPILSYGGSSMLSIMIGLGIAMSCKVNDKEEIN